MNGSSAYIFTFVNGYFCFCFSIQSLGCDTYLYLFMQQILYRDSEMPSSKNDLKNADTVLENGM